MAAGFLAVDLGAESGRVIRGDLDSGRLRIAEAARFPTGAETIDDRLRWDLNRIITDVVAGLCAGGAAGPVESVGVDTWGVDFGLLDGRGRLIELPVAYRDPRTEGVMERFLERVPRERVYGRTGVQFLPFNTLYQLAAMAESGDPALAAARRLLLVPDLVNRALTGSEVSEWTNATTTQCFDPRGGAWDEDLVREAGVDPSILPEVVPPSTVLGPLAPDVRAATGLGAVPVIAPATHDTGSAVAAVPAHGEGWAFLSSGTWSLVGVETPAPVITEAAREANLTNEGGIAGTNRLLRNVMGLWLVQRLRAEAGDSVSYEILMDEAASAPPLTCLVDPDDPRFLNPPSMRDAITDFLVETGQAAPAGRGAYVRCALESLALAYRTVLVDLKRVTGREIETIHVVGGGARNRLLAQMTADATGLEVVAGPVEATAIGNMLGQALALGRVVDLAAARDLVRRSFAPERFAPQGADRWDEAYERLLGRRD
jgi:rhamnulokinase